MADQSPGRGKQGGIGGCSFSGGTASAGERQGTRPRAVSSWLLHPGLFGVAQTVFDVLFGVVLLGH